MEHAMGFLKIRRNRELPMYLQSSQYRESLLFYKMFHYCFAKCISSTPLDYCDQFCIRKNRNYHLCKLCSDNHKIAINA
jgi:hypothetical protein